MRLLLVFLFISCVLVSSAKAHALLEGIYCGAENCYEVLGVNRESTKSEIGKAYRQLAKKAHPDLHRGEEDWQPITFHRIATAYEILRDDEERKDYDYMLDHPDEHYRNYYRYYSRRLSPKVDVRLVLIVTISIISVIQYYSRWQRYESAIQHFVSVPKYRNRALEMIQHDQDKGRKGTKSKLSKADQKLEQEKLIREVIEEKMDIQGSYSKPEYVDLLWIQLIILPYTIYKYLFWYLCWIYKFNILKKPYGIEEQLYIIRKNLGIGQHQFNAIEEHTIDDYLRKELWIKEKFKVWKLQEEEDLKKSMAENPKYKAYRRYMKNNGPGRMTFED